jgi:hypothetical protein
MVAAFIFLRCDGAIETRRIKVSWRGSQRVERWQTKSKEGDIGNFRTLRK